MEKKIARKIEGQMKVMARAETGAQPAFGAKIVEMILSDYGLRGIWEKDVRGMAEELRRRRLRLRELLREKHTPGEWDFLVEQKGMFSYVMVPFHSFFLSCLLACLLYSILSDYRFSVYRLGDISNDQLDALREEYHIYLQDSGRISIA